MTRLRNYELLREPQRPPSIDGAAVLTVLRVPPENEGMRLDRFVQSQLKRTTRTRAQFIIEKSAFTPEGRPHQKADRVRSEQWICLWRAPWDEAFTDTELPILYEDEDLCAVDKPPMIPVHPTARYFRSTVVKLLEHKRPEQRFYLAHRLDRETSGVLLLTKNKEADRHIKKQFAGLDPETGRPSALRFVAKRYLAVCHGDPGRESFIVDSPLEPDPTSSLRVKMRVAMVGGLESLTRCTLVSRHRSRKTGADYSVIACDLETGRQHQIRVHLASIGCPLVGEKLYSGDDDLFRRGADGTLTSQDQELLQLERQALHAQTLELEHPREARRVRITSPLPRDIAEFLDAQEKLN
jgi:23S rRNA pseudouridine1911/1915/1917 synthase